MTERSRKRRLDLLTPLTNSLYEQLGGQLNGEVRARLRLYLNENNIFRYEISDIKWLMFTQLEFQLGYDI